MCLRLIVAAAMLGLSLMAASCGGRSVSETDVASQLEQNVPGATAVNCTHVSGDQYSCGAVVAGKRTTFSVTASGSNFSMGR